MEDQISKANDNLENAAEALQELTTPGFWTKQHLIEMGTDFLKVILIFAIGFIIIKCLIHIVKKIMKKSGVSASGIYYIETILKFVLYLILVTIAASNVGINAGSIVAFVASFGLAIALALKGSLTDLASGIMLILTRPVTVGDRIFIEGDDDFYVVEQIKLFDTYLRNGKNIIVIVPNEKMAQNKVKNLSQSTFVYADVEIGVAYGSDIDFVKRIIEETVRSQDILQDKDVIISLKNLNESSVDFYIGVPVMPENFGAIKGKIREELYKAFMRHQIEIPFPQRDVRMINQD